MTHRTPVTAAPPALPPSPAPRSPLRYPGGKTRAREKILSLIPPRTPVICSPFLGGGSIELACAHASIPVRGYDIYPPLVNFWHHALATPVRLAREVRKYYPLSKETFYHLQQTPPQGGGGGPSVMPPYSIPSIVPHMPEQLIRAVTWQTNTPGLPRGQLNAWNTLA